MTLSLKLMTMVELTGTLPAPPAGAVPVTAGAASGGTVLNEKVKSDAIESGGSLVSVSVI